MGSQSGSAMRVRWPDPLAVGTVCDSWEKWGSRGIPRSQTWRGYTALKTRKHSLPGANVSRSWPSFVTFAFEQELEAAGRRESAGCGSWGLRARRLLPDLVRAAERLRRGGASWESGGRGRAAVASRTSFLRWWQVPSRVLRASHPWRVPSRQQARSDGGRARGPRGRADPRHATDRRVAQVEQERRRCGF
jgi:hypothetical protein